LPLENDETDAGSRRPRNLAPRMARCCRIGRPDAPRTGGQV